MKDTFTITNKLIYDAIWGEDCCHHLGFSGYVYSDNNYIGRAFLEYCICRVFNIHKLPGCGYDRYHGNDWFFAKLPEKDVIDACDEIKRLYDYTQNRLQNSGRVINGKVELVRCLRGFEKNEVVNQLKNENMNKILLPVNTFTSYAHDNVLSNYSGEYCNHQMNIRVNVNVEDILLWDSYVSYYSRGECKYLMYMGDCEAEVFVINREINGWKELDRSCFIYESLPEIQGFISSAPTLEHEIRLNNSPVCSKGYVRPCEEEDFLTKYVMKRNITKRKKEDYNLISVKRIVEK